MAIKFFSDENNIYLIYSSAYGLDWIKYKLENGTARLRRTFYLQKKNLVHSSLNAEYDDESLVFKIGNLSDDYYHFSAEILGLDHDVHIYKSIKLDTKLFVSRSSIDISVFSLIDRLSTSDIIIIGGDKEGAIPEEIFRILLAKFPTSAVIRYIAESRIEEILSGYLNLKYSPSERLQKLVPERRIENHLDISGIKQLDIQKLSSIKQTLEDMLQDENYTEDEWQRGISKLFLLIYPQYVAFFSKVVIPDSLSVESDKREIDVMLVDAVGCIDVLEIKRPFKSSVLRRGKYRDNYIPAIELQGAIVQTEKYLLQLNRWGRNGEKELQRRFGSYLPDGVKIHINNPKGIILNGRSNDFVSAQHEDFELIRRQYSNISDVMTYDDLLLRLDNIINMLEKDSNTGIED